MLKEFFFDLFLFGAAIEEWRGREYFMSIMLGIVGAMAWVVTISLVIVVLLFGETCFFSREETFRGQITANTYHEAYVTMVLVGKVTVPQYHPAKNVVEFSGHSFEICPEDAAKFPVGMEIEKTYNVGIFTGNESPK